MQYPFKNGFKNRAKIVIVTTVQYSTVPLIVCVRDKMSNTELMSCVVWSEGRCNSN